MTDDRFALPGTWTLWPVAALRSAGLPYDRLEDLSAGGLLDRPAGEDRNAAIDALNAAAIDRAVLDDWFREALAWQNPTMVDNWVQDHARRLGAGGRGLRKKGDRFSSVARYLQRYCSKNESIGFFGPVAWARVGDGDEPVAEPTVGGDGGLRAVTVHLETWAVAALAASWAEDEALRPHLPVRLDPATSLGTGMLLRPQRPAEQPSGLQREVLASVDGHLSSHEVVDAVGGHDGERRRVVAETLAALIDRGVLLVGLRVAHHARPEQQLSAQLASLGHAPTRVELQGRLDGVVAARDVLARTAGRRGDPDGVHEAIAAVQAAFVKAGGTGVAQRRARYGRTPVYIDARRDTDVVLPERLLEPLVTPLALLLRSARWFVGEVAEAVSGPIERRYRDLARGGRDVTLADLRFAVVDVIDDAVEEVAEDFGLRWAEVLDSAAADEGSWIGPHEVRLPTTAVAQVLEALFPERALGWAGARYHSPDVLLARDGDTWTWVLGELHLALNTLENRVFWTHADDPEELVRLTAEDLAGGRVVPVYPVSSSETSARTYPPSALDPPGLYRYWSYTSDSGHAGEEPSVPATAVKVEEASGRLVGRVTDGGHGSWSAPVLEFLGDFLTAAVVDRFRVRDRAQHLPRLVLDDVVVERESWTIPSASVPVPAAGAPPPDHGFDELRAWARGLGMPDQVYVTAPGEPKPYLVDLGSPLLVRGLVRTVHRLAREETGSPAPITFVEMSPRPAQLWLEGPDGRTHTSELRLVAVDARDHPVALSTGPTPTERHRKVDPS